MPSASVNIAWLTISRILALVLLFFAHTQLFRYLGPFGTGQYQFVLSFTLLFYTIVDFGLQQYIIKKISEAQDKARQYFENFFIFMSLSAPLMFAVMLIAGFLMGYEPLVMRAIFVAGLGMVAMAILSPYIAVVTAFQDLKKVAAINFLNSVVSFSIIFAAIIFQQYIVFLLSAQLVSSVLAWLFYRRFAKIYVPDYSFRHALVNFDLNFMKGIFKYGWPFMILVAFGALYNRIDIVLLNYFLDYDQVGLYSTAYKFYDLMVFFPAAVYSALYPLFSNLMAKLELKEVARILQNYVRLMIAAALPIAVGGSILATPLINLIAGQEFLAADSSLAILIWATAMLFIYIPVNAIIISQMTKQAAMITAANVVINIVGNIILIPTLGILAAALMTLVSETFQAIFYFTYTNKRIVRFPVFRSFIKPATAAIVMGAAVWLVRDQFLLIPIIVGGIVYISGLLILRFFRAEDIEALKRLTNRKKTV